LVSIGVLQDVQDERDTDEVGDEPL
jgi:hypothetical protein